MRTVIEIASELIQKHEGLRLKPYRCTASKLTIGYGRNLDDVGITEEEAIQMLERDIANAVVDCEVLLQIGQNIKLKTLSDNRQAVLIDMCFNLGFNRLKRFHNMFTAIGHQDYKWAAEEMLDSRWAKQVGQRAITLAKIMKEG